MYKLKVKQGNKTYCKKYASMREVFGEIHNVLFGYTPRIDRINLAELSETKKLYPDTRFYLSIVSDIFEN